MSISTFFISKAATRNLKRGARRALPDVSSSHMSEGIAASLGFNTNAAMLASFAKKDTVKVCKPNNHRLFERLAELGYATVPKEVKPLPDFQHSYSPFRSYPLRSKRGPRWNAWRNLMVSAINAGLEQRQFGLSPQENWWQGAAPENQKCNRGMYRFTFDGDVPAVATVDAISGDELSILVLLNPREKYVDVNLSYGGLRIADASAHGWLERRCGAWIQDTGTTLSCKRILQPRLENLQAEPRGYADQGSFFM